MSDLPNYFAERVSQFEKECARLRRNGGGAQGVVFLGDSLVEGYRGPLPWVNRGIAGDHLQWPEVNVFERLGSDRLHPNPLGIVTLIGINDISADAAAGARHVNAYRHLLTNLRQLHPAARLGVCSVLPTGGPLRHLLPAVRELNRELVDVAASFGATYWDLYERFVDARTGEADAALLQDDGVHLTRRGYGVMTAFVRAHAHDLELVRPTGGDATDALLRGRVRRDAARAWELVGPALRMPTPRSAVDPTAALDRKALAQTIATSYGAECWSHKFEGAEQEQIVVAQIAPEIDFLCRYAVSRSPLFRDLYLGSRASFFAQNKALWAGRPDGLRGALDRDREIWLAAIDASGASSARLRSLFEAAFAELRARIAAVPPKTVRLLFVGDCLLEDVELLLGGQLLCQGLLAKVEFVLSKNPVEQMRVIRERRGTKLDGVVYSPLSWEFDPEFKSLLEPGLRSKQSVNAELETIWQRIAGTVKLLEESFECPIYVHNTAAAVRASDEIRRAIKSLLTFPKRDYARKELARRIGGLVDELNRSSLQHMVLIDELAAVRDLHDDLTLGRVLYYSDAIHPAALSCEVAFQLSHYVAAAARFVGKKVVVCDLDNTLWDGVIGEGLGVRHHRRRQTILKALEQKGVVLAINSKNDPANIRWDDSVLNESDFVASEVSWGSKSVAMKKLQQTLNLKIKDFVFIDDRSDEREMTTQEYPELTAMDPCAEETWAIFDAWAKLLGDDDGDRTQLYRERAEREKVIGETVDEKLAAEMFSKLHLKIDIRRSTTDDLKRIHELINRTNQWNLQGTRCSFADVKAWHESPRHVIHTARVSDKFGDMGLICVCVTELVDDALTIPAFVLSCRVFGYGVETVVLEQIKKDAAARFGAPKVRGTYIENAHNKPCKAMYESHGFRFEEGAWLYPGGKATAPDPVWFRGG